METGNFAGILKLKMGANVMLVANIDIDGHLLNDLNGKVMGFQKC